MTEAHDHHRGDDAQNNAAGHCEAHAIIPRLVQQQAVFLRRSRGSVVLRARIGRRRGGRRGGGRRVGRGSRNSLHIKAKHKKESTASTRGTITFPSSTSFTGWLLLEAEFISTEMRSYSTLLSFRSFPGTHDSPQGLPVREMCTSPFGPFTRKCMSVTPRAILPLIKPFSSTGVPVISVTRGHRFTISIVSAKTLERYAQKQMASKPSSSRTLRKSRPRYP